MNPPARYPGLTPERRVVLDLAFAGYGLSSQIVSRSGELLGIADPAAKFDPAPGATVARVGLGLGLAKLAAGGARFDLIVADVAERATCAAVGIFAPPPQLMPAGARRILGCAPPTPKPPARKDLATAVWQAANTLLSECGEALLRLHVTAVNSLVKSKAPGLSRIWWGRVEGEYVCLYLRANLEGRAPPPPCREAPTFAQRELHLRKCFTGTDWTRGQRGRFTQLLLP